MDSSKVIFSLQRELDYDYLLPFSTPLCLMCGTNSKYMYTTCTSALDLLHLATCCQFQLTKLTGLNIFVCISFMFQCKCSMNWSISCVHLPDSLFQLGENNQIIIECTGAYGNMPQSAFLTGNKIVLCTYMSYLNLALEHYVWPNTEFNSETCKKGRVCMWKGIGFPPQGLVSHVVFIWNQQNT